MGAAALPRRIPVEMIQGMSGRLTVNQAKLRLLNPLLLWTTLVPRLKRSLDLDWHAPTTVLHCFANPASQGALRTWIQVRLAPVQAQMLLMSMSKRPVPMRLQT
jgi:hypothetical protein